MIDKSAIRIRPYTEADRDQVLETLFLGFTTVGDRIFQKTVRHRTTALSILAKSLTYTLVLELLLVTLSAVNNSTTRTGKGAGGVLEDFRTLQEALMEPTTIQGMVGQFLKPSFILLGAGITVLVTLATVYSIYSSNQKDTQIYFQGCLEEDLGDIVAYYQKDVSPVEKQDKDKTGNRSATTPKKNRSQFWVACLESHPQLVLGCISLDDVAAHAESLLSKHIKQGSPASTFEQPSEFDAELRRLSVHPNYRRLGVAKLLMQTLKDSAKKQGFKRVILSTTIHQSEALVGYIRFGFERERLVKFTEFFTLWYGQLKLNATAKEIEEQKDNQALYLKEVGLLN
ncbi:hypothetical protein BG015_006766 [Linnemannia schmuckeri]|uniref:N-acetyltransferase domain-containing protein n=1 Tax=Linnemannia schmuckeri TaxID=64567 RepID=A0A9P5S246_9FUNG|nr:hypothetical protein BG015_006766 [Linnemannia schmuckeri]